MINAHQRNFVFLGGWWLASAVVLLLSLGGGWEEHDGDRLHPSSAFFSPSTAVVVNAFQVQQTRRRVTAGVGAQLLSSPYPTSRTGSGNCNKIYDLHHHSSSLVRLYDSNNPQQSDAAESSAATTTTKMMTTATVVAPSIESASEELRGVQAEFEKRMAAAQTLAEAEAIRREYMGKKGPVNKVMGYMRLLSADDKPRLGAVVNEIKEALDARVSERLQALEREQILRRMESERIDATLPGTTRMADIGHRHPLSITMERAVDIFTRLGYDTVTDCRDSPEVETDYNCFEALNSPKDHPARDMQDTFYLTEDMEILLRSHTSSVQIRQLAKRKPPLRIVAPGRVYRKDDIDATHSLMFHQVEILALEKRGELNLGHLKGTVEYFLKNMFGPDIKIRYRGSYFPFTEPSMEVDVFFRGKWMEVLGCGMVDPNVLEMAGVDPNEFSGFAAGFGVERFAMVIHGISDLREFYKNDKRFLQQFPFFYDDGLDSFLSGNNEVKEESDPRSEHVPDPPANSLDDLRTKTMNLPVPSETVNGGTGDGCLDSHQTISKLPATSSTASSEIDISKLDIRVGVIRKAWPHEDADRLYCEEIDLGEETGPRRIASGIRDHYRLEELENRRVLVVANLKARKLAGFASHGMVLCASRSATALGDEDGGGGGKTTVHFVDPPEGAAIGERVWVEGFEGEPATENQLLKKKMLERIFPDLRTDGDGVATYRGAALRTSVGPCTAPLPNAEIS